MKPSRPKADRLADHVERGIAADRLMNDELIMAWFEGQRAEFTEAMVAAPVSDDETRRECAVKLKLLDWLKKHIETEAAQGRQAARKQEKAIAHA